jgi:hypothetical protein
MPDYRLIAAIIEPIPRELRADIPGVAGDSGIPDSACASGRTPIRGASGMVGMGAYSSGSEMPTVL